MVSNSSLGLLAKTVALFLFGPPPPQRNILQKEKLLVLMWTESFFTVYQALDWEFFSDAEGTFSHLSGPVKKNKNFRTVVKTRVMQSFDAQNQVAGCFLEEHKIVFPKGFDRYLVIGHSWWDSLKALFNSSSGQSTRAPEIRSIKILMLCWHWARTCMHSNFTVT